MSNLVELPGEANPLNETNLLQALSLATSAQPQQVKAYTAQLQEWETKLGYYTMLQDVFIQNTLPVEVRLLAIIQLKNGVDKYWRKSAANAISTEEREKIRTRLLASSVYESRDTLAAQNAVVTAKISRHDYPSNWPDLFKDLIDLVKTLSEPSRPAKELSRVLLVTHHVVKELATVRLQRARAAFYAATPSLFSMLEQLYLFRMQQWQEEMQKSFSKFSLQALNFLNDNERVLKIIRRLLVAGYEFPHRDTEISEFWDITRQHTQLFLELLHHPDVHPAYLSSIGQQLKQVAKLHLDMIRDHPTSFSLLPNTISLVLTYWSSAVILRRRQLAEPDSISEEMGAVYEAFNLRALLILQTCFKTVHTPSQQFKYKNSEGKEEPAQAKEIIKTQLFTESFLLDLCNTLVDVFFVYTDGDIEVFTTEPEEWEMREGTGSDVHERSVKPCAERVFLNLAIHHKELILQPLLTKLAELCSLSNTNIRTKDAAYSALGVAAPILHKALDFNGFFVNNLIPELQNRQPEHNILRRRICLVLAQWISLDISDANRPLVYQVFHHLLDKSIPDNDQAVRITAGKHFSDILCAWEFEASQFLEYGIAILTQIVDLIQEVELVETKLALLTTIGAMVDAMDRHIQAYADQIVALLPKLWNDNAQENLMKQSIVAILFKLVKAMGKDSGPIHAMMLPTIRSALEPGSETQLYLLDDSLDLLAAIAKQTPGPVTTDLLSSDFTSMLPLIYPIYEMDQDYIRKALKITESYILLTPSFVIQENVRRGLLNALTSILTVKKHDIIDSVAELVELLIRAVQALGDEQAAQGITEALLECGFLSHILDSIQGNWVTRQSSGPNRKDPPRDWRNETSYFGVLARLVLASPQSFFSAVQRWAQARQLDAQKEISNLIDEWLSHMDAVGAPVKSKLLCLALTKLLESGESWVLDRLQDLMSMWTSIVVDLRDNEDSMTDTLVYSSPPVVTDKDIPEDERRRAAMYSDPVHTIILGQFVQYHLQNVIQRCGGPARFQEDWLVNVDKDVIKSFGELGIL